MIIKLESSIDSEVKARIKAGVLFKTEGEGLIDAANDIIIIANG